MPIQHHTVCGEDVRLVVLPPYTRKAFEAWRRFVASDSLFGLDVETTAIPMLEGNRKAFGPALALSEYVVPSDLPEAVYRRGYRPGERRTIKTRSIQFGTETEGWVLDVDHPQWRKHIASFLANEAKRFISHNASYDVTRVKHEYGIELGARSIDTLPMVRLRWPGRTAPFGPSGLKEVCGYLLKDRGLLEAENTLHARFADLYRVRDGSKLPKSFEPGKSPCRNCKSAPSDPVSLRGFCDLCYIHAIGYNATVDEWGWDNIALDDPIFLAYSGLDAVYVRRLLPALSEELKHRGMSALGKREQRIKRYFLPSGKRVDMEWTSETKRQITEEMGAAAEVVMEATGLKVRSPKFRTEWLAKRGCRVKSLDKAHRPLLLLRYEDDETIGPVLRAYDEFMSNTNLLTNLTTILRHAEGGQGYAYPTINTLQAHTGRMSAVAPAMQTFKKTDPRLRGCFIARDGYVFIGADYDNQEIRIGAYVSGDESLAKVLASGESQHVITAQGIYGADFIDKKTCPEMYHKAKTLDFAQQYGAMPPTIAATLGISEPEARELWLKWRETYAGLVRWTDEMAQRKHVVNPYGRVIPCDPFRAYANGNYFIQSTGRDVLGEAICNLADTGWAPFFWLPVHDEMVLEVPEDLAVEGCRALTDNMTLSLPGHPDWVLPAEGELIGTRWRGL